MQYAADLSQIENGEARTLDATTFQAANDKDAATKGLDWAATALAALGGISSVVRLQIAQDGRGVLSKVYEL